MSTDEIVVADEERDTELAPFTLRLADVRGSAASKTGDGAGDCSVLESYGFAEGLSSSVLGWHSNSSRLLNFPPWIGGTKFVHLPSIRPITYLFMRARASGE